MIVWGGSYNSGALYFPSLDSWRPTSTGVNCPSSGIHSTAIWTGNEMIIWGVNNSNAGSRYRPITDTWQSTSTGTNCPSGRWGHTAIWTGNEMIIWGGSSQNTGGRYNPSNDSWQPTSTGTNCPIARSNHKAIWTGNEMIIWGGDTVGTLYSNAGGKYDPLSDTWTTTSVGTNCPVGRSEFSAVWTGTEMIVWGGFAYYAPGSYAFFSSGARYNPSSDNWTSTSIGNNVPCARRQHTAVWTGQEMIVWGGYYSSYDTIYLSSGSRYSPYTDEWVPTASANNCPSGRYGHSSVWTGSEMIVWGGQTNSGQVNSGGRYIPQVDSWIPTSITANSPSPRCLHSTIWTGAEMIIWGGVNAGNTGSRYSPTIDGWTTISTSNAPSSRNSHSAVWSGNEMIIWGGTNGISYYNSGARYNPISNTWSVISISAALVNRSNHTAIWTGTEMLVWGGYSYDTTSHYYNSGGKYDPANDLWSTTSLDVNTPSGRTYHSAVWTGTNMVIWGGSDATSFFNNGGTYNPVGDSWTALSTGGACPAGRDRHSAVWTGSEMVIWGGYSFDTTYHCYSSGGRYSPGTNTWKATATSGAPAPRFRHTGIWTGGEMIVWGGQDYDGTTHYLNTGARYSPSSDAWVQTPTDMNCPSGRSQHTAVWNGSGMLVWGGYNGGTYFQNGGLYLPAPLVVGPSDVCEPGPARMATQTYTSYQWVKDSVDIPGATNSFYDATSAGTYAVTVVFPDGSLCTSLGYQVTFNGNPSPVISGASSGCFSPGVALSTQAYDTYQWHIGGIDVVGATDQNLTVAESGTYTVTVSDSNGCAATSPGYDVAISANPTPTVTGPAPACLPANLETQFFSSYQWRLDGLPIPDATQQAYLATAAGTYTVEVSDGAGCGAVSAGFAVASNPDPVISGAGSGCSLQGVALSTGSYSSYQWRLDGNPIPAATGQSFMAMQSGNYSVSVTGALGCTGLSPSHEVTIFQNPSPTISGNTAGCNNPGVSLSTGPFSSYQWKRDGSPISDATGQTYIATQSGTYTVEVTDANACAATSPGHSVSIQMNPAPVILGPPSGCATPGVSLSTGAFSTYQWYLDGNPIPGGTTSALTVSTGGSYTVSVSDAQGCQGTSPAHTVTVHSNPAPVITGNNSGCAEPGVVLSTGLFSTYQWAKDGVQIAGATGQSYTAHAAGTYTVMVADTNGCEGTSTGHAVTMHDNPSPTIAGPNPACLPSTLSTQASASYQWLKDGAPIAGATNQSYEAASSGSYSVQVVDIDGCTGTAPAFAVSENPSPAVSGPSSACYSATLSTGSFVSYQWSLDGNPLSGATAQQYTAIQSGSYTVAVTGSGGCAGTSSPHALTVLPLPSPAISGGSSGCANPGVPLSTGAFATYQWKLEGTAIPGATGMSHTATQGGTYTVTVSDANGCEGTSPGHPVSIQSNPSPTIAGPSPACGSGTISTQGFSTYQWYRNGNLIPGASGQSFFASAPGSYTVKVGDGNCQGTSPPFVIFPNPSPSVSGPSSGCAAPGVTLSSGPFVSYQWKLNGAEIFGATAGSLTANQSGQYTVTVTDSNGCQGTSASFALAIHQNPVPVITGADYGCVSPGVVLSADAYTTYQWSRNGSVIAGATGQSYTAVLGGSYTVSVTDGYGCQGASLPNSVTVYNNPAPSVSGPAPACVPASLSTQFFSTYQWLLDGSPISGATNRNFTASQAGQYTVQVFDANGCFGLSTPFSVSYYPAPTITGQETGCATVQLATEAAAYYQWNLNGSPLTGATSQTLSAVQSGSYTVTSTNSGGCTSTSAPKGVTVLPAPAPPVEGPTYNTCPATMVTLNTADAVTYQWFLNGDQIAGATHKSYSVTVTGTYSVSVVYANGCSATSAQIPVFIDFCPASEVSPVSCNFPARLAEDQISSTGYYIYFQRLDTLEGYNLYEGSLGTWYSHANTPGSRCSISATDLGTGEMRAEVSPSAGDHYYLVTAYAGGIEGPSGFRTGGQEIDRAQSTCTP